MSSFQLGSRTTSVTGQNVTLTWTDSAGNTYSYLSAREFTAKWGNELDDQYVIGTDIPLGLTYGFKGELTLKKVYSTELGAGGTSEQLSQFVTPSGGALPVISIVWTGKDTQGSPATRTFTCSTVIPYDYDFASSDVKAVYETVKAKFYSRPVVT